MSRLASLRAGWPARAVAGATVAYSVSMTVAPTVLAKPAGLTDARGKVSPGLTALIRSIGVRDVALAAALAIAPIGYPMRVLTVARVVSDGADAIWFGRIVNDPSARRKVIGVAVGWALLEAVTGMWSSSDRRASPAVIAGALLPAAAPISVGA